MLKNTTYTGFITSLKENQIFVFGSNPVGINGNLLKNTGGASLAALKNNWVLQGERLDNKLSSTGKSWGITTIAYPGRKRSCSPKQIMDGIRTLYDYARKHPNLEFLIAYKAEGVLLSGYSHQEMASMFAVEVPPLNLVFDRPFLDLISASYNVSVLDPDTNVNPKSNKLHPL